MKMNWLSNEPKYINFTLMECPTLTEYINFTNILTVSLSFTGAKTKSVITVESPKWSSDLFYV